MSGCWLWVFCAPLCNAPVPVRRFAPGTGSADVPERNYGRAPQKWPHAGSSPDEGSGTLVCPQSAENRENADWTSAL